jgi:hypothetical protein
MLGQTSQTIGDFENPASVFGVNESLRRVNREVAILVLRPLQGHRAIRSNHCDLVTFKYGNRRFDIERTVHRLLECEDIESLVRLREANVSANLWRDEPVGGVEDRFRVCVNPFAGFSQRVCFRLNDGAVCSRSNVKKEIAVLGDHVNEVEDQSRNIHVRAGVGGSVRTSACVDLISSSSERRLTDYNHSCKDPCLD